MSFKEKFNIGVLLVALACSIASSWVPILNTTWVAPDRPRPSVPSRERSMITIKEYRSDSPWDILLMMASINGMVAAMSAAGSVAWLVGLLLNVASDMSFVALFVLVSVVLAVVHNFFPSGPGLAALVTTPVLGLVAAVGGNYWRGPHPHHRGVVRPCHDGPLGFGAPGILCGPLV